MNIRSLSPAQRSLFLGRERIKYQTQYPDTKRTGLRYYDGKPVRYTLHAAIKYDASTRRIDGCLAIYTSLGEDVLKAVIGTTCDQLTFLERLKILPLDARIPYIKSKAKRVASPRIKGL